MDKYIEINNSKIYYIEEGEGYPILLFHGARFNARIWKETGTIDKLASNGFKVYSIDFPGFGESENGNFNSISEFIKLFIEKLNLKKVDILGASMGGGNVLEFSLDNKNLVNKIILIGPVKVKENKDKLKLLDGIDILLIRGKNDSIFTEEDAKIFLYNVKSSKLINIGSKHACYLDEPEEFNNEIINFLKR
ncbi:2-hydroxy-6-oxononadienedioate/2-hydroxy-6-oxononatrienedioate hydrolase [Nanobdella aerobiophila]|uniref:2-hydroxy-6-oxononadienedioate/2-hydroxy-6-oxononatrienedioate hydrolase n=1 Tax=Nanobdella aerobiophila TaxID=2586965 RepID=A0A915WSJ9_9ARCH|nr:alpha/beta hydrolase [Nanobdella aerobiophila]BBL45385.1 2-hydroxy-6-oxononadienedioate/2-hydroxy-6-oxononatrienedioate hydrolase [Nanobdella aerobiophila]